MSQPRKDIIIVGGSLGGLFTGTVLTRLGHNVRILERNPTPLLHNQGAGIVAGGDVQAFFSRYDRSNRTRGRNIDGLVVTSHARQYLNHEGEVIDFEDRAQRMTSWDLLYHVLRANFDGIESEYADVPQKEDGDGNGLYEYGCTVTGLKDVEDKMEVEYEKRVDEEKTESKSLVANLLIACDGGSSTVRTILVPDVQRKYAGYVAWRGTVPEHELSEEAVKTLAEKFTFYHAPALQILAYLIPGRNGALGKGQRLMNYVWYCNYPEGSPEHHELMTDVHGKRHPVTVPVGSMQPQVWKKQQGYAEEVLPPQFAELVRKTREPFVQAITDVICQQQIFSGGKVVLLGDALAGFRPHTAASTSQAAFDAMTLADLMEGEVDLKEFEEQCMSYAMAVQRAGVDMGDKSQFGSHPLADAERKNMGAVRH